MDANSRSNPSRPGRLSCAPPRLQIATALTLVNPKYQQVVCLYRTATQHSSLPLSLSVVTCLSAWAANPLAWVCCAFIRNETLSSPLVYANIAHMTFRSLCRDFSLFFNNKIKMKIMKTVSADRRVNTLGKGRIIFYWIKVAWVANDIHTKYLLHRLNIEQILITYQYSSS